MSCSLYMIQINVVCNKLLFAELLKNSGVCLLHQHAGVCVCARAKSAYSFQQVKHTCESSSCCFEEPEQGKQRRRKMNVLLTPFFLQPFSCIAFVVYFNLIHISFFYSSLNYLSLKIVLVCICLLLSLRQHYR